MHAATITAESFIGPVYQPARTAPNWLLFAAMLAFVGTVSVYDSYLVLRTGSDIQEFEQNPVGSWLIGCNHGNPTLFLAAKAVGTSLVLVFLTVLYRHRQRLAVPVAYAVVLFQTGLLIYLETA